MFYLQVKLLSRCAKSLEYIQCRVAAVHIFRVEVALDKFTRLFFDPGFYFVSTKIHRLEEEVNILTSDRKHGTKTVSVIEVPVI